MSDITDDKIILNPTDYPKGTRFIFNDSKSIDDQPIGEIVIERYYPPTTLNNFWKAFFQGLGKDKSSKYSFVTVHLFKSDLASIIFPDDQIDKEFSHASS